MNEREATRVVAGEYKETLKKMAKEIRSMKDERSFKNNGYVDGLETMRFNFRHMHIAMCELRGTPREKIETPGQHNKPTDYCVNLHKKEFAIKVANITTEVEEVKVEKVVLPVGHNTVVQYA